MSKRFGLLLKFLIAYKAVRFCTLGDENVTVFEIFSNKVAFVFLDIHNIQLHGQLSKVPFIVKYTKCSK